MQDFADGDMSRAVVHLSLRGRQKKCTKSMLLLSRNGILNLAGGPVKMSSGVLDPPIENVVQFRGCERTGPVFAVRRDLTERARVMRYDAEWTDNLYE